MAPRSYWKGYLTLSLVTCPVSMMPATSDAGKVRFHTLNARTGNRVASQYVDAVTARPVAEEDEVKGYSRGEDDHVILEDEEIDSVALDSTRTIDIDMFVPADSIGWVWLDQPHYLSPADRIGTEAFAVIRDAMARTKTVGISRLVMYRRERAVMLEPRGKGITLWTLRYGDEVRDEADYFRGLPREKPQTRLMTLMRKLIDERTVPWDPSMVDDPVQARLLDIIATKKKSPKRRVRARAPEKGAESGNVIDIMDALRKSIRSERK